jgi:hypothetical protein
MSHPPPIRQIGTVLPHSSFDGNPDSNYADALCV